MYPRGEGLRGAFCKAASSVVDARARLTAAKVSARDAKTTSPVDLPATQPGTSRGPLTAIGLMDSTGDPESFDDATPTLPSAHLKGKSPLTNSAVAREAPNTGAQAAFVHASKTTQDVPMPEIPVDVPRL
uniref:Uncharacterized protein n=1 Tax=Mycena chlorophos TaxID=658473 RepID=A0ABQ0M4N6_MYCCL|nr:predicted protein [Mycena chlorophos]